jgi:hypothetical protein
MTATVEPVTEHENPALERTCLACGAPLADDQEWCLQCGSAATIIHSSPDWWAPVAVIAVVVAAALAGFIYALSSA